MVDQKKAGERQILIAAENEKKVLVFAHP